MKIQKSLKRIALISSTILLVTSFSFASFAESVDDDLANDQLQYRALGDNNLLNPLSGYNNSTATSRSTTSYNFSGDGTFGGQNNTYNDLNVTSNGALTVQSGATLNNVTLNTTLGNTQEMANLISITYGIFYVLTHAYSSESDSSISVSNSYGSISIPLFNYGDWPMFVFNEASGTLSSSASGEYYGTLPAVVNFGFQCLQTSFRDFAYLLVYNFNNLRSDILSGFTSLIDSQTYDYWTLTPSADADNETFSKTVTSQTGTWHSVVLNRLDYLGDVLTFSFDRFFNWYYPLDDVLPEYWRVYNSDSGEQEEIGLAGLMYNISWYLGNLYLLESASAALDGMEQAVEDVTTTFENVEAQEQAVIDSVSSHIESFNPNVSDFGAFRALPWMSNYLQQIYVSLGTYGLVITIGLFLGVCLQIIGFLRYK